MDKVEDEHDVEGLRWKGDCYRQVDHRYHIL